MSTGFVKIRRGIIDHVRDGNLSLTEFAVFQLLVIQAETSTGSHTINAAVLRSCYFPEMTRDAAQRTLISLEKKGFIFRLYPASSKRAYRYWINKFEATSGPNRLRRTDLSQVFESKNISDLRWLDSAAEVQAETQTQIPTQIPNSSKEIKNKELSSSVGRETGPKALEHSVTHLESCSAIGGTALPEETFSLISSSSVPLLSPASPRRHAKNKGNGNTVDPRSAEFKTAVERNWVENNPDLPFLWGAADGAALKKLLSAGKLSLERFEFCLASRSRSENPGSNCGHRASKFLLSILSYSRGALDKFGNLKVPLGPVTSAPSGQKSLAQQNAEYLENKAALLRADVGSSVAHA